MSLFQKHFQKAFLWLRERLREVLLLLVALYRTVGTTHLGGACRFSPSCSEYAVEALKAHQPLRALKLILFRIFRCRPGGPYGYDPVPSCGDCKNARQ